MVLKFSRFECELGGAIPARGHAPARNLRFPGLDLQQDLVRGGCRAKFTQPVQGSPC